MPVCLCLFVVVVVCMFLYLSTKGVARGGPGVPVTLLCKHFFKQTTYNIPWRKRHDDIV